MTPPESPSGTPPTQPTLIRRASWEKVEGVLDEVWELVKSSPAAAHWSRTAFYPYVARASASDALQAKAMFLAYATVAVPATVETGGDPLMPPIDRMVGFAAFSAIMTMGASESTLENMAVAPEWQQQGVGRRLLAAGLLWCRAHAAGKVFLEVRESNRAAIALYERAGFSVVGHRPGYYREPAEDGLQMQKLLVRAASTG